MLGWMLYAVVVSALLGAAAWAAERSAETRRASTRLYWSLAIMVSLALPVVISSVSILPPTLNAPIVNPPSAPVVPVPLRQMTSSALAPARWLEHLPVTPTLDKALLYAWAGVSCLLAVGIAVNGLLLQRAKAHWVKARVAGVEVFVSETVGPAVVGLLQPRVVVPRWILTAPSEDQALIIAHERSHLDADDARLLAIAILLIICIPWNLPLWWQLRRLRQAIEVDCDSRVLRGGGELCRYGETLLMVGERRSSNLAVVAAMSEPASDLEQRLNKMLPRPRKFAWATATGLSALGLVLAASAAEISPPNRDVVPMATTTSAATLDRYVGFYDLNGLAVMGVTRRGTQLYVQFTGSPPAAVYPSAPGDYIWGDGGIRFLTAASGPATAAVRHRKGGADESMPRMTEAAALKFRDDLLTRIESMTPAPGSEAALRRVMPTILAGQPDYAMLDPELASLVRRQRPLVASAIGAFGPVQSIAFSGVGPAGNDVYLVRQARGVSRWTVRMGRDGRIAAMQITPWS